MQIVINGKRQELPAGTNVAVLLQELGVETRHVAVEVNHELVPRSKHAEHRLADGDQLEVVTLVGGG